MSKFIKETITTQEDNGSPIVNSADEKGATGIQTIEYLVYFLFGVLEILLAFRLVLKLLGASLSSNFVSFIYDLSGVFVVPFEGIFRRGFTEGIETISVFEPGTLVAMIVYAFVAWGIVKIIQILSGRKQTD